METKRSQRFRDAKITNMMFGHRGKDDTDNAELKPRTMS